MNHVPFTKFNHDNYIWLLNNDQSLPIGFMQSNLARNKADISFYYLDSVDQKFKPTYLKAEQDDLAPLDLGSHIVQPGKNSTFLFAPQNLKCQSTDIIVVNAQVNGKSKFFKPDLVRLDFTNDVKLVNDDEKVFAPLLQEGDQMFMFILRGLPVWSLGGLGRSVTVSFPKGCTAQIKNASAFSLRGRIPQMEIVQWNYDGQSGFINTTSNNIAKINFDVSFLKDCVGIIVEAVDSNKYFKELNSANSDTNSLINLRSIKQKGTIAFPPNLFPYPGAYKIRMRPINKDGKQCAFCSDHFMLNVSK